MNLFIAIVVLCGHASAAEPPAWNGTYEVTMDDPQITAEIDAAIEKASLQFPFAVRWIVRSRLERVKTWCRTYKVDASGDNWTHSCDQNDPLSRTLDGKPTKLELPDQTLDVTMKPTSDGVFQRFAGPEGGRDQTWHFYDDYVIVDFSVFSDQLNEPVAWSLRYNKAQR